jgi:hypothetical protein
VDDKASTSSVALNKLVTLPDGRVGRLVGLHREVTLEYGKTMDNYGSVSRIIAHEPLCDILVGSISVTVPYANLIEVN